MADMLLIIFFFHIFNIFEKGVCTFKKLSTLIVQTTFPTLQKDPMNKKGKKKKKSYCQEMRIIERRS